MKKDNTIVFPGSFDPWTYWHEAVVRDYLDINPVGKVEILIGVNPNKKTTFSASERKILIEKTIPENIKKRVEVIIHSWVIADYVYENNKSGILKWVRDWKDFEYEKEIALASKKFAWDVKTIIIPQLDPLKNTISSSSLKAISQFSGDIASLANPIVREALRMRQTGKFIVWVTWWIASGKSTLCNALADYSKDKNLAITYINLDQITKELHESFEFPLFQNIRNKIAEKFGKKVLNTDWTTDKKTLWDIVFASKEKMEILMEIMLEPMIHILRKKVDSIKNPWIILVEWAIIFDRKLTYIFDENIVHIGTDKSEQRKRIKQRDNLSDEQIEHRLNNQISLTKRVSWIKNMQKKYENRFFMDIDSKTYNIPEIYGSMILEYEKRKNFEY